MTIKAILFDLGGVLVELNSEAHLLPLLGGRMRREQMWELWLRSPAVRAHESGQISAEEFSQRIVAELDLPTTPEQFQRDFAGWIVGLFPEARAILQACAARYQTALLSNITAVHWPLVESFNILPYLHHVHVSFRVGTLKPDPIYFETALQRVGCAASEAIFFDDNALNIAGAQAVGIESVRVVGAQALNRALVERGLLAA